MKTDSVDQFESAAAQARLHPQDLAEIREIARGARAERLLSPPMAERVAAIERRAGPGTDRLRAIRRFLRTPHPGLNGRTPLEMLVESHDGQAIERLLEGASDDAGRPTDASTPPELPFAGLSRTLAESGSIAGAAERPRLRRRLPPEREAADPDDD